MIMQEQYKNIFLKNNNILIQHIIIYIFFRPNYAYLQLYNQQLSEKETKLPQEHSRIKELYCKSCSRFLCPECLMTHSEDGHEPDYIHVVKYAPEVAMPLLDHMLTDISGNDSDMNMDAVEFVESLATVVPYLKEVFEEHQKASEMLKGALSQVSMYLSSLKKTSYLEQIIKNTKIDQKRLEGGIKDKQLESVISIARRMESGLEKDSGDSVKLEEIKKMIDILADHHQYSDLVDNLQLLMQKCQHLKLSQSCSDWKLDRKYFTSKMALSEDCLEYGNSAGSGYPAIIGDTPLEMGIYAWKVTPISLCCGGSEGFGIIELEKYKSIFAADSVTPTANNSMIGLFHNNNVKGMTVVAGSTCKNGDTYTVKVDLMLNEMTIKGPDCHLRAELKPETVYVPCFSLGCRSNKLIIKPLDFIEDEQNGQTKSLLLV